MSFGSPPGEAGVEGATDATVVRAAETTDLRLVWVRDSSE